MGLRISTNQRGYLSLFRNIGVTQTNLERNALRLATGLRINSAADDPSGLVISQQLRAHIAGTQTTIDQLSQRANLFNTADSALSEVSDLLVSIRSSAIAGLGSLTPDELAAEQENINTAIAGIASIASSTQYTNQRLLDSSSSIDITAKSAQIIDVDVRRLTLGINTSQTFNVNLTTPATRGRTTAVDPAGNAVVAGGSADLRITGPLGTKDFTLADAATGNDLLSAINTYTSSTGVYAEINGTGVDLVTVDAGSDQTFTLAQVSGAGSFTPGTLTATGTDAVASINGLTTYARGNFLQATSSTFNVSFQLDDSAVAGNYSFTATKSGVLVNTQPAAGNEFYVGLPFADPSVLGTPERSYGTGTIGGFLNTLATGQVNDLSSNPGNALYIVDSAISEVSLSQGFIGGVVSNLLDSSINALGAGQDNLQNAYDDLVSLDYARETADFARNQILQESQIATLVSLNINNRDVFKLLFTSNA